METLEAGQAVTLELGGEPPQRVQALVQSANADEYVLAVNCGREERPDNLRPGVPVCVRYVTALGRHEARSFIVNVALVPTITIMLSKLEGLCTTQQRAHFRVFAAMPIDVEVVLSVVEKLADRCDRGTTIDVSAGGVRFETGLGLAIDDRVRIGVHVPAEFRQGGLPEELSCHARVVRAQPTALERFQVAVRSSFPREIERDKWVQLTMNLQRRRG